MALLLVVTQGAWAGVDQGQPDGAPSVQERRREELREALKQQSAQRGLSVAAQAPDDGSAQRRLTAKERADLREQLREHSSEAAPRRP